MSHILTILTVILSVLCISPDIQAQLDFKVFQPFDKRPMRLVQGMSLASDEETLYFTLPHSEYQKSIGLRLSDDQPRLAIYETTKTESGWGTPKLLHFSGRYIDYEPTISPDNTLLLFNSKRSMNSTASSKINIWFSQKSVDSWSEPKSLIYINTVDMDEAYPTIASNGVLVYSKEIKQKGISRYYLYQTIFEGEQTAVGEQLSLFDDMTNLGDPCLSPDGSFLIFTRFEPDDWSNTCDLYISYFESDTWTPPVKLEQLNSSGPDFSPYVTANGQWLYYRRDYLFRRVKIEELL